MPRIVRCALIQASNALSTDRPLDQIRKAMIDKHLKLIEKAARKKAQIPPLQPPLSIRVSMLPLAQQTITSHSLCSCLERIVVQRREVRLLGRRALLRRNGPGSPLAAA